MTGLALTPDEMSLVQEILERHLPGREVWVFGSRTRPSPKTFSDLDLVLHGETPVGIETLAKLSEAFSDSGLPFKVDLVDWATASEAFRQIILAQKMVLQPRPQKHSA